MSRKDMIIDFESIGKDAIKSPAVDVAWTDFEWDRFKDNPYSLEELVDTVRTAKFCVATQMTNGCSYTQDDLNWWLRLPKEARHKLKISDNDLTYQEFSAIFLKYLRQAGKIEYWWSRGNSFDPVFLEKMMRDCGEWELMNQYIYWWRIRDIRTWIDAKFDFSTKSGFVPIADVDYWNRAFIQHDSRHDVAADILRLQTIYRAENNLEQTKR